MPGSLDGFALPIAQDPGGLGGWSTFLIFLPAILIFYFLIFLPQRQQEKKRRSMIDALKKNDKVLTAGGIYGTVISVDAAADKLVLRIDDDKGVKMTLTRSSVVRVLDASERAAEAS